MTNRPVLHQGYETPSRPRHSAHGGVASSIERGIGVSVRSVAATKLPDGFRTLPAVVGVVLAVVGACLLLAAGLFGPDRGLDHAVSLGTIAVLSGFALVHSRSHEFGTLLSVAIAGAPAVVVAAVIAASGGSASYFSVGLAPAIMLSAALAASIRARNPIAFAGIAISAPLTLTITMNVMDNSSGNLDRLAVEIPVYATAGLVAALLVLSHRASAELRNLIDGIAREAASDLDSERVYWRVSTEIEKLLSYDRLAIVAGADEPNSSIVFSRETVESTTDRPLQFRSGISVPLGPPSEPQGRLVLYGLMEDQYSDQDIELIERVATQIWPAILNAWQHAQAIQMTEERVYALGVAREKTELQNARAELVRVNDELKWQYDAVRDSRSRLMEAHEVAKKAVAEELHGTVQTKLYAAWMRLGRVRDNLLAEGHPESPELTRLVDSLDAIREQDIRLLSHRLHPNIIRLSLGAGLRSMRDHYYESIEVDLVISDDAAALEIGGVSEVDESVRLGLYRIAELALGNVLKHAESDTCRIELAYDKATALLSLTIVDKGVGFPPNARVPDGLGIVTMNDYADALGGSLKITSLPGEGAAVSVTVPLTASIGPGQAGAAIGTVVNMHWASPMDEVD